MNLIAVTGASGFLGRRLTHVLSSKGYSIRALSRNGEAIAGAKENRASGDLSNSELSPLVEGCEAVIHCAARVHVTKREDMDYARALYQLHNVKVTERLAIAARAAGCRRFVQIGSAGAIRSISEPGEIIDDETEETPENPYSESKLDADRILAALTTDDFRPVSLRPPAIFGPNVKAWFAMLSGFARRGLPLPLGRIDNRRSYLFIDNFVEAIEAALRGRFVGNFVVTDSEPISTAHLYRMLLEQFGHPDRTWKWPPMLIRIPAKLVLRRRANRLLGDAVYDGSRFARVANWQPRYSTHEGLARTVKATLVSKAAH